MKPISLSVLRRMCYGIALGALVFAPLGSFATSPAFAQRLEVSLEFREPLEPFGRWVEHPRWGEVWVPADVPPDWRPYKLGRWVYTEEWGWYWLAEEDWGWIPYHYGRWVLDRRLGWVWVPGDEWAPAWVRWRRGDDVVGWAPLPPDDIIFEEEVDPEPGYWLFVPYRSFTAPRIARYIVPAPRIGVYLRNTVVVNRTVRLRQRGVRIAVNPGVPPAFIAAAVGRPLRAVEVRPRVLVGTRGVAGANEIRIEEIRRQRAQGERQGRARSAAAPQRETVIERTTTTIRPARSVPPPQALPRGEPGRLGETPPRAARGATPAATDQDQRAPGTRPTTQPAPQVPGAAPTTREQQPTREQPAPAQDAGQPTRAPRSVAPTPPPPGAAPPPERQQQPQQAPAARTAPPPAIERRAPPAPTREERRDTEPTRRVAPPPPPPPPPTAAPPRGPAAAPPPAAAPIRPVAPPPPAAAAPPARPAPPPAAAAPVRPAAPPAAAPQAPARAPAAPPPGQRGKQPPSQEDQQKGR